MGIRRFVSSRDLGRISKRKLYTDKKDVICHFSRTFILNGINVPGTSPDLLDRAILIELERLPEEERRDKRGLEARFNEIRPRLFGAIVEAISEAILVRDSIYLDWLPRVADWCLWGCAVAEALGIGQERFLTAHYRSIREQNQELLEAERYMIHRLEEFRNAETYGIRPKRVFREAATRYLEEATKQSLGRDAQLLKLLALFIGDLPLESVHIGTLQEYVKDRTKAGWKKRTINYGLATVRRILNIAAKMSGLTNTVFRGFRGYGFTTPSIRSVEDFGPRE